MTPWNAPGPLSVRAVAIPLICGNTVILKSSEVSPMSISIVVEALHEVLSVVIFANATKHKLSKAGIPKGVINFLNVSRETAPARVSEIISHPAVRKLNVCTLLEKLFVND